ncbi:hypothetical protein C7N43_06490 [Sphingobacteriales bacterium UPWRP_1]|nr:hypothetical protein BVG80_12535 [Sphingobacteriales bacterium TSM_CSM]PSJ77855.1 hypothetical protein C7N43_06490 [Sphingobacteriales bacterium UPWRP_1]
MRKFCLTRAVFFVLVSVLVASIQPATAQNNRFGSGVVLDEEKYAQVPLATPLTTKNYDNIPYERSLKKYCPIPGDQLGTGTCVGWAAAYGARTIIEALGNGWDNVRKKNVVNTNAFSPSFVYRQVLAFEGQDYDCYIGVHISDALSIMKRIGNVKMNDYPFDENCQFTPTGDQIRDAIRFRIKDYQRLSFVKDDNTKVGKVRHSLANDLPVIVGMQIFENFKELKHENNTWNPNRGEKGQPSIHAMLVVGYDDQNQTFELMNSWGTEWANEGFIYVKYDDFNKYVKEAYQVIYELPAGEPVNNFAASLDYRELAMQPDGNEMNCTPEVIGSMQAAQSGPVYAMHNAYTPWTGYQVMLTMGSKNMNVYAFSFDDNNQLDLLYPFQPDVMAMYTTENTPTTTVSPMIPYARSTVALPHEDYCMQLDNGTGTVNCFLFTKEPIDLQQISAQLPQLTGNLYDRLQYILGPRLTSPGEVTYDAAKIGFEANLDNDRIVPLIVDMNHFVKKP